MLYATLPHMSILRRNEAACGHRHGPGLQPEASDRRRAYHGSGCDHPGPGTGDHEGAEREVRLRHDHDHPRPGDHRRGMR